MTNQEEQKEWVDVPTKRGVWEPEVGDELTGVYVKKEHIEFMDKPNWKYHIKTKHPEAVNGTIIVYGTSILNSAMSGKDLVGKKIRIILEKEIPTKDPKKNALKKFKVQVSLKPSDPLYQQYKEEAKSLKHYQQGKQGTEEPDTLADQDDPEARNDVEIYQKQYQDNHYDEKPNKQQLIREIQIDEDLQNYDRKRILDQIERMVISGEIKE